jgi:hypothetical protein
MSLGCVLAHALVKKKSRNARAGQNGSKIEMRRAPMQHRQVCTKRANMGKGIYAMHVREKKNIYARLSYPLKEGEQFSHRHDAGPSRHKRE